MDEVFNLYYRPSLAEDPILLLTGLDYDAAQDLQLFLSPLVESEVERNYQGMPVYVGVYFEEAA